MTADELKARAAALVAGAHAEAVAWCRDRSWEVRAPVLLYLAYVLVRDLAAKDVEYASWFAGITLGIHEAGHVVFRPFGEYLTILGGSLLQWLVPLVAAGALWRTQRDAFGVAFCLGWLGDSFFASAVYCSDARGERNLPLVSFEGQGLSVDLGGGDWRAILEPLGLLSHDLGVARLLKLVGVGWFAAALALGAWCCVTMHRLRSAPPPPPPAWAGGGRPAGPRPTQGTP